MEKTRKALNIIALLAVLVVNTLAQTLPINGMTPGDVSDRYPTLVTPAGYVFSIWSVIYIGLIGFIVYQARRDTGSRPPVERISYWFILSCALNITWIFVWHHLLIGWSVVVMIALLVTLISLYHRIRYGRESRAIGEYWLVQVPFSLYLAWICVATIVNVTVFLKNSGWDGWGISSESWAVILLIFATGLALTFSFKRKDVPFAIVFIWAFIGIGAEHGSVPVVRNTAWILAGILGVYAVFLLFKALRDRKRWDQSYVHS
ncbi:TspO/MBR family protein [Paenibacillus sp. FJAT-26967]|uniref:TspO/MBR family protein n=1 Tax=Paenibacillus sp. FJAT-26967 TaxID=1729690 RepID=UPI000838FE04|nr:TspO/MBR family protein [Paenibacillus sp. FJAT-26967]